MTLPTNPQNNPNRGNGLDVRSGSPDVSPQTSSDHETQTLHKRVPSVSKSDKYDLNKSSEPATSALIRSNSQEPASERDRKSSEKVKKKPAWYSVFCPTYKSRSDDFRRLFKDFPADERLIVEYSCALQKEILYQGRVYVSQNYLCFYSNILFRETQLCLKWKDVTALTKEKTALVIPNAILVHTPEKNYFFTTFASRDKTYLMLFRIWQNALMDKHMSSQDMWHLVHDCYGEELGLTSDDDDYISSISPIHEEGVVMIKPDHILDSFNVEAALIQSNPEVKKEVSSAPQNAQNVTQGMHSDQLPMDLSDSSPSESESEKWGGAVECPIPHEGKLMLELPVSLHVDQLFAHLFTESTFFVNLHEHMKSTDLKHSEWVKNPCTNLKGRTVNLTVQLGQAIGPKSSQVTESQKMLPCSKPGEIYVIEVEASNAGIPYADAFYIQTHYCLTRGDEPGTSNIKVYCQIKYRKSVWTLAKSFIEKNCWAGMEDYFQNLEKALEAECERTRIAMATGVVSTKRKIRRIKCVNKPSLPSPVVEDKLYKLEDLIPVKNTTVQTDSLIWIVFFTLFILLVLNAALYYKLWGLEQSEKISTDPSTINIDTNILPTTQEEWQNLLKRQEKLHSFEVDGWMRVLKASVHLLQQVEKSLTALQTSIQSAIDEGITGQELPDVPPKEL